MTDETAAETNAEHSSPVAVLNVALRHARILILVPLLAMTLAAVLAIMGGSRYLAESTFKPETPQAPSGGGFFSVAAQLGMDMSSLTRGDGIDYYARLVQSREVLSEAVRTEYRLSGESRESGGTGESRGSGESGESSGGREVTLLEHYGVKGETEQERVFQAVQQLRDVMGVTVDQAAGVITLTTEARDPELAVQVNARLLELLNQFNLEKRQSQARAERAFVEAQTEAASNELEAAEERLAEFMTTNRRYQASPELGTEAERLQRRVDFRQQVYTSLAQSYEQARLDEVRNTPVFTVLDRPEGSARQVGGVLSTMLMGLVLGVVLAGFIVFLLEYTRAQRVKHPGEFRELESRMSGLFSRRKH